MADHNEQGKRGEEIACSYLKSKGYEILDRNYRFQRAEIDIIAKYQNELVIVEVKTRNQTEQVDISQLISQRQQSQIIHAAEGYIQENEIDIETRFDVIIIFIQAANQTVEHHKQAFYPE